MTDVNDFNVWKFNRNKFSDFSHYSIVPKAVDPKLINFYIYKKSLMVKYLSKF